MCGKMQDLTLTTFQISCDDGRIKVTFSRQFKKLQAKEML